MAMHADSCELFSLRTVEYCACEPGKRASLITVNHEKICIHCNCIRPVHCIRYTPFFVKTWEVVLPVHDLDAARYRPIVGVL